MKKLISIYFALIAFYGFAQTSPDVMRLDSTINLLQEQNKISFEQERYALEEQRKQTQLIVTAVLTVIMGLALGGFIIWNRSRKENLKIEERNFRLEEKKLELQAKELDRKQGNYISVDNTSESTPNDGGFIFISLPENERRLFNDLLKGFEDYANLKGYSISFSVDNSEKDKIGFKFTINNSGISVSTNKVREDIQEYINKVKKGEDISDIPVVINEEEHNLVLTQLLNRINFLQHNYQLQKNTVDYYEGFIKKLNNGITPQPSVFVQTGGSHQPQQFLATNSPGTIQGTNIHDVESTIRIAESFNERKNQIEDLSKLIGLLHLSEQKGKVPEVKNVVKNLEKVKDELTEEAQPDKKSVEKWLKKAKTYFDVAKFGKEVVEFGHKVFESFDVTSLT